MTSPGEEKENMLGSLRELCQGKIAEPEKLELPL
jgi:hypothetical protein